MNAIAGLIDRVPARLRREIAAAALAVLATIAFGSLLMLVLGVAPGRVWWEMLAHTATEPHQLGHVLYRATGIAMCGVAVALALDAGLFDIGVEAQLTAGVLTCSVVGVALPAGTPSVVAVPACLLAAAAGGAAVGAIGGAMRALRGASEVITGIMLNFIVGGIALWLGTSKLFVGGTTTGAPIAAGAELPQFGFGGAAFNASVVIALAMVAGVWWLRARTTWGVAWLAVGRDPATARRVGISVERMQVVVLTGAGALAGLAAANFVMGHKHAFEDGLGRGTGLLGISAALLGRQHPIGVVIAALFLGLLAGAGLSVGDLVPKELFEILQGVVILAVSASSVWIARRAEGRA